MWCVGDAEGKFARIDFVAEMKGCIVFLEVDEHQHCGYMVGCDMKRMAKIVETLTLGGNTLPILFLRYNPDAYSVDGKHCKTSIKDKEAKLVSILNCDSAATATKGKLGPHSDQTLGIMYLYYNQDSEGHPDLVWDHEFNPIMRDCVVA